MMNIATLIEGAPTDFWSGILERWGVATTLLIMLSIALWKVSHAIAQWFRDDVFPLIRDATKAHIKFVESTEARIEGIERRTDEILETTKSINDNLEAFRRRLDEHDSKRERGG